jgi:hypothetical protein
MESERRIERETKMREKMAQKNPERCSSIENGIDKVRADGIERKRER